jgi:hypothetical protein
MLNFNWFLLFGRTAFLYEYLQQFAFDKLQYSPIHFSASVLITVCTLSANFSLLTASPLILFLKISRDKWKREGEEDVGKVEKLKRRSEK